MNWTKLNYTEPAVLRGILAALLGLGASLGLTLPSDLPGQLDAGIVALTTLLPVVQALWTRRHVFSKQTVDQLAALLPSQRTPGPDHAG